jgi:outer membrane lipoprotein-sorting protein
MRRSGFFLLFFLFGCASCAPLPHAPPPPPPPEEFLSRLRDRSRELTGLKGLAHVQVSAPGKNFRSQEVIFARRPGFLRLETLSPLGTPLFYFAAAGEELSMYHPGENRYYRGPVRARYLADILPGGLEPQEIVAILLGGVPLFPHEDFSWRFDRREEIWFLDLKDAAGKIAQTLGLDPLSRRIFFAEYSLQGVIRRVSFEDYREASNGSFPHKIRFESPAARTWVTVEYQDIALNPEWADRDFHLDVPRGAEVIPLE